MIILFTQSYCLSSPRPTTSHQARGVIVSEVTCQGATFMSMPVEYRPQFKDISMQESALTLTLGGYI